MVSPEVRQLYDIEDRARDLARIERQALRQLESVPILDRIEQYLDELSRRGLPKSALGKAVTYARNQWEALRRYVGDGQLTIDNNVSERTLRIQAIGRKNWEFLGSADAGPRAAVLFTILAGAKRHRLEPWAYLRDVLLHLSAGEADLEPLLPDRWAANHPEHVLQHRLDESRRKATRQKERRQRRRGARRQEGVRATNRVVGRGSTVRTDGWPLNARPVGRCTRLVGPCANTEKTQTLDWVVRTLSEVKDDFIRSVASFEPAVPLITFLHYYMFARDSVATRSIAGLTDYLKPSTGSVGEVDETARFWCIIGLIESGQIDIAEGFIKRFKPSDNRLLMAIYLGCFIRSQLRISTTEQKVIAERICGRIESKIRILLDRVVDEMKGLLLEVQHGQIRARFPEDRSGKKAGG